MSEEAIRKAIREAINGALEDADRLAQARMRASDMLMDAVRREILGLRDLDEDQATGSV